ncbi:MAG: T9SS type A sorting domain-containing protein, partial [Ignavibacteriaceae bacterium]|nr:T9SS type A sorting domain-containing protein [Ignavibacteriaceae bacterium]
AGSSSLDEIRFWENSLITSVEGNSKNPVPGQFELFNNFPNPFNPKTTIRYTLPASDVVSIKVFNALGNEIKILLNEEKQAGSYDVEWNADGYSSGIYFYSVAAGNFRETKKMILIK